MKLRKRSHSQLEADEANNGFGKAKRAYIYNYFGKTLSRSGFKFTEIGKNSKGLFLGLQNSV